ncbi:hypothetical protein HG531_003325 [Fusarium graminearum]|nr:hypothetical protein HG531_003325 [Fusarium graminearum]
MFYQSSGKDNGNSSSTHGVELLSTATRHRSSRRPGTTTSARTGRRSGHQSGGSSTRSRHNRNSSVRAVDCKGRAHKAVLDVARLVITAADQGTLLAGGTAAEIVKGLLGKFRADDSKAGVGGLRGRILKSVPPDVDVSEHGATDILIECPGVLERWNTFANSLSTNGPSSLSDPDRLAIGSSLNLVPGGLEQVCTLGDGVVLGVLEVRVGIHAEPVTSLDDSVIGCIGISGPCVNVTDRHRLEASSLDSAAGLLDIVYEDGRVGAGVLVVLETSGRDTVEIFVSDRDTSDEAIELVTVLVDSVLQGGNLVGEAIARGPETKEEASLGLDSGRNGRDGLVGRATLDHGVETSAGESTVSTLEASSSVELVLEVGLSLGATICKGRAIIEALERSAGRAGDSSHDTMQYALMRDLGLLTNVHARTRAKPRSMQDFSQD